MRGRGLRHLRNTLLRYRPQIPRSASVSLFQRRLTSGTRLPGVDGARRACTDEILRPVGQILAAELLGPGGTAGAPKCTALLRMMRGQGAVPHAILHRLQCHVHTHVHRHRPTLTCAMACGVADEDGVT